ncbi:MAG: sigma-70 family RNA polymerase sigma factor [Fuerstiella sp.]|nr:sigma-70 family RNA polymerase sigma factor [Fuerstiella sp.]
MTDDTDAGRLSRIATRWSMLREAHDGATLAQNEAKHELLERYSRCVYRYLLGAVRNEETAEDQSHEFAVRFLSGNFHRASPEKGRFRDYVKTVLINLVNDYFRTQGKWADQIDVENVAPEVAPADPDGQETSFEQALAEDILNQAWTKLESGNKRYYAVLQLRIQAPDLNAREMAELLSQQLNEDIAHATVRKTLERSRVRFAEMLVEAANETLACDSTERLSSELKDLGLLSYCRVALEKRIEDDQ